PVEMMRRALEPLKIQEYETIKNMNDFEWKSWSGTYAYVIDVTLCTCIEERLIMKLSPL
ncbi:hypothetical protein CEXT_630321, partial [Caerostris extrusa]